MLMMNEFFSGFSSALAAVAPAGTIGVIAEGAVWR